MKNLKPFKIALTMFCVMLLFNAKAQHVASKSSFDGVWAGVLKNADRKEMISVIKVTNGLANRYDYNSETGKLEKYTFIKEFTMLLGNNLSYTWLNKGGVWTETQSYLISYLKPDNLYCHLVRQVNNEQEDEDNAGLNNEWATYFKGVLIKYKSLEEFERLMKK